MNQRGLTLTEMVMVMVLLGLIVLFAGPRIADALVRQNVRSARDGIATMHARAKAVAVQRGRPTMLVFSADTMLIVSRAPLTGNVDTVGAMENVFDRWGVAVDRTSDTLRFDARGLGIGGAAQQIIAYRAQYADTLFINAVGRVVR